MTTNSGGHHGQSVFFEIQAAQRAADSSKCVDMYVGKYIEKELQLTKMAKPRKGRWPKSRNPVVVQSKDGGIARDIAGHCCQQRTKAVHQANVALAAAHRAGIKGTAGRRHQGLALRPMHKAGCSKTDSENLKDVLHRAAPHLDQGPKDTWRWL